VKVVTGIRFKAGRSALDSFQVLFAREKNAPVVRPGQGLPIYGSELTPRAR
jgi:hypothetical protein